MVDEVKEMFDNNRRERFNWTTRMSKIPPREDGEIRRRIVAKYGPNVFRQFSDDMIVRSFLGAGETGEVYEVCLTRRSECFALKLITGEHTDYEINMTKLASDLGLGPKLRMFDVQEDPYHFAIMLIDRVETTAFKYLLHPRSRAEISDLMLGIEALMERACKAKFSHGDMHLENIGLISTVLDGKFVLVPVLIDFNYSADYRSDTDITCRMAQFADFSQLTNESILDDMHKDNRTPYLNELDRIERRIGTLTDSWY